MSASRYVLAITGSSGVSLALEFLKAVSEMTDVSLSLIVSPGAELVFERECGIRGVGKTPEEIRRGIIGDLFPSERLDIFRYDDMAAPVSSGSYIHQGMVILPCSMSTLSAVAQGITINLIHRAASVALKQSWPLIIAPRESPLSAVHLKNMLELSRSGATVFPATVSHYHKPGSIQDLDRFIAMRVLDLLGHHQESDRRWKG